LIVAAEKYKKVMRVIIAEINKDIRILLAYPIEIAFWIISPLLWAVPLIFQGKALIGGVQSTAFGNLAGTAEYIPYVLIGAIFSTYMFTAVWNMGNAFRNEMFYGTLEHVLSSPVRPIYILLGKGLYNSILSTFFVTIQILICVFIFGLNLTFSKIIPMLFFLILLMIGLYGVGFIAAALTLLIKEAHGILHLFEYILFLFTPIRYPVEVHPITRTVSLVIPLTYALIALRGILLGIEFDFVKNSLILLGIDIIIIPVGIWIFNRIERHTKLKGTLAHY
jgi:ABC-2 type transport system permease protein